MSPKHQGYVLLAIIVFIILSIVTVIAISIVMTRPNAPRPVVYQPAAREATPEENERALRELRERNAPPRKKTFDEYMEDEAIRRRAEEREKDRLFEGR